jgi:hypothetical protein
MAERCENDKSALRIALDFPDDTIIGEHSALVEQVRRTYPHTIRHVPEPSDLNCAPYALRLSNNAIYRAIARDFDREIFAGRQFVEWLLSGRIREIEHPKSGSLALYFSGAVWRHAGLVSGPRRITSKWGTFPVYEHDFCDVPARYGDRLRFFETMSMDDALALFLEYARSCGASAEDITNIIAETYGSSSA